MAFTCSQILSTIFLFYLLFIINASPCLSRVPFRTPTAPLPAKIQRPEGPQTHIRPLASLRALLGANKGTHSKGILELKRYLSKLGYMNVTNSNSTNQDLFDHELESALKKYQLYFKLNVTGTLDTQTVSKLLTPRCGVPDHSPHKGTEADKSILFAFLPGTPKWPAWKRNLTYDFEIGTRDDVLMPIATALEDWSRVSGFTFQRIPDYLQADIKISFQVGDHGDGSPFDGPWGIVAHTLLPITKGIIHFDGAENWVDGVEQDHIDIQSVGAHELGHVLGLGHSSDPAALMYPFMNPGERKGLTQDDINGICTLYEN